VDTLNVIHSIISSASTISAMERCFAPTQRELGSFFDDKKISIHLPTLNEERWVGDTLESLVSQQLYKDIRERNKLKLNIIVLDSSSTDRTIEVAKKYVGEKNIWTAPKGKISARDFGVRKDDADIIVSVDADTVYPQGWLSAILRPFEDPDVVMVHGPKLSRPLGGIIHRSTRVCFILLKQSRAVQEIFHHASATNSAFRRDIYLLNPFRLDIDQMDRNVLWVEEEFFWPYKMEKFGNVVYLPDTAVLSSDRHRLFSGDPHSDEYERARKKGIRF